MREGVRIGVIIGTCTPFVLRPVQDSPGQFELLDERCVHGIMDGEAFSASMEHIPVREITLR